MSDRSAIGASGRTVGRAGIWVAGARPRTLVAAVVPVGLGAVAGWLVWQDHRRACLVRCSAGLHHPVLWRLPLAALVALALQVAVNYANDYSDGVRGTDDQRAGPVRLVGQGLASPSAVRRAALVALGVAGLAGLGLAASTSWWLLALGAASALAAWGYTGGPKPYGYLGLGEVFVFVFFGLVATAGTAYVLDGTWSGKPVVLGAVLAGLLACALLEANNLRDVPGDAAAGKRTLAVRLGRRRAGWAYLVTLLGALALVLVLAALVTPWAALAFLAVPAAWRPVRLALGPGEGRSLLPLLVGTARFQLLVGALAALGLALAGAQR
ncbi:1,4-dihydroxy-2-naphthoate polyprenyltransferase [Aciditerrimonas ferrireducens]|uniref:1,4-dihydroxy-2-naphthoate polyprenyltransferase n=1 Tax=Aciditerrimonas ferrireducens TaxID=667306 RepID=UPI0020068FD6|nr:1,4-dihydroxy-2-naphthoate polyprenyltransferase [Aciditerrimonas ferrireducens]MCK4177253.1 1,4-dihydroxy-2-naphthoate polyprenyltransferase [Aciditerrimonas ferrireducens]